MKKTQPRRQRVPKRGPGVAELEKILKEQETHDSSMNELRDLSPPPFLLHRTHPAHSLNPPHPHLPPPSFPVPVFPPMVLPWTTNAPFLRNPDYFPPTTTAATGSFSGGTGNGVPPLVERSFFPTTLEEEEEEEGRKANTLPTFSSHNTSPSHTPAPSPLLRENNSEYFEFPSTVNYTPGSAPSSASASASASSSSAAAAARQFHQIEHPSSQRSTNYTCIPTIPEEEKMVSGKRLRPFPVESHRDSNFHSKAPMFTNMAVRESSSSSSSSLEMNHSSSNFDRIMRDSKRGFHWQLMSSCSSTKSSSSSGSYQQFNFFPSQENVEDSQQRAGGASASDYNKITSNSLYESNSCSKGSKETVVGSYSKQAAESEAEAEGEGDDIDLNLKL